MSMTCKYSQKVTLIKGKNAQIAKKQAHAFLARLNLIDWRLLGELITNRKQKFLSKFWTVLFEKLEVKLFYSIAYHSQTNGSSEKTNQIIMIALQFFVYIFNNFGVQFQVFSQIQAIINNISSSSTNKIPNKIAYNFFSCYFFDLLAVFPTPNILATCVDISKAISFALLNQKVTYNQKYQPLFMIIAE